MGQTLFSHAAAAVSVAVLSGSGHVTSGIIDIFDATASDEDDAVSMVVFADGLRVITAAMGSSM